MNEYKTVSRINDINHDEKSHSSLEQALLHAVREAITYVEEGHELQIKPYKNGVYQLEACGETLVRIFPVY